jgi:hypothetical protein
MRDVELPRGEEREIVRDRDREYSLCGAVTHTPSTVGAFRIVDERGRRAFTAAPTSRASGATTPRSTARTCAKRSGSVSVTPASSGSRSIGT